MIIPGLLYTYYVHCRGYGPISYPRYFTDIYLGLGDEPLDWAGPSWPGLVHVAPGGGLRYRDPGAELGERLVLAQVDQREQCLVEAAELPPAGVACAAVLVEQPGTCSTSSCGTEPTGPFRSLVCWVESPRQRRGALPRHHPG